MCIRDRGNFYCSNKDCSFCLWEDNKFFSSKKKKLTKKIAKELLDKGWCRVTGLYTPKKPQPVSYTHLDVYKRKG